MTKIDDPLARAQHTREVVKSLRTDIILGKYAKGTRLIESKIADTLGASRAPVRTAFQLLAQEGLVINLANGGTEVVGFSIKQAMDLFDLRLLLEKRALELILDSDSFVFRPLFESMEQLEQYLPQAEAAEIPSSETSRLDILFHRSLVMMADSTPLLVAWNTMTNIFQELLEITNMTSSSYRHFFEDHRKLADLIIQRNRSSIDELVAHITRAKNIIIERLETRL
ncbi:GntR family transcriptional regulator [Cohnella fermenti]|uniref:GntR family transcriptional regulator n=1 Tax=Cohnella fermenti TaxID=2565925 RepID=A0A4S4C999_9BACL|nr:GntR family transcriptional regulator [Cohnella fermenti]THF84632.1 GntR family transcriptional regulator [Cohnella fermenti]